VGDLQPQQVWLNSDAMNLALKPQSLIHWSSGVVPLTRQTVGSSPACA